jgi:outer membrane protein assembly factor BamA
MTKKRRIFIPTFLIPVIFVFIAVTGSVSFAQQKTTEQPDSVWVQKDLPEVLRKALNKPSVDKKHKKGSLFLIPIVASNPATGFMIGAGGQYAQKLKGSDRYSSFNLSAQITTKGQKMVFLKNNIYTRGNKLFLNGDWRYLIFSQPTYGLGTTAPEGGILDYQFGLGGIETTLDSLAQPMKFDHLKFHQTVSFELKENIYAGIGYNFDLYSNIVDEKLSLMQGDTLITSHFAYNTFYGFDTKRYYSSAINLSISYDSRDNILNPYKGFYALASWRAGLKFLGNKENTGFYHLEYRSYHSLSKRIPRHLITFWAMGNFSSVGEFPYMLLPATAYDQRGRSGRGYVQGRFRGNNLVYAETEYRFPLSKTGGILGGVVFLNVTTADNPILKLKLFDSVKPGYGFGLRIMADKRSRTNVVLDFAFGEQSSGFYLNVSETF